LYQLRFHARGLYSNFSCEYVTSVVICSNSSSYSPLDEWWSGVALAVCVAAVGAVGGLWRFLSPSLLACAAALHNARCLPALVPAGALL